MLFQPEHKVNAVPSFGKDLSSLFNFILMTDTGRSVVSTRNNNSVLLQPYGFLLWAHKILPSLVEASFFFFFTFVLCISILLQITQLVKETPAIAAKQIYMGNNGCISDSCNNQLTVRYAI